MIYVSFYLFFNFFQRFYVNLLTSVVFIDYFLKILHVKKNMAMKERQIHRALETHTDVCEYRHIGKI